MHQINGLLEQRTIALAILAVGAIVGMAAPGITEPLERHALPALFVVVVLSMVSLARLPMSDLFNGGRAVWRLVLWQQVFLPCFVISVGILAQFSDSMLVLATVTACSGSLFASPMLAELLSLDRRQAVLGMMASTFVMPASLYVFLTMVHGRGTALDLAQYTQRVALFLIVPVLVCGICRFFGTKLSEPAWKRMETGSRWVSVVALLVFVMGMMHPVSTLLARDASEVVLLLALSTSLTIGMAALTATVMYRFGLEVALTTAILSGFRNVGFAFALVGAGLDPDLSAYIGLSMLPMFVAPVLMRLVALLKAPTARSMPVHTGAAASV